MARGILPEPNRVPSRLREGRSCLQGRHSKKNDSVKMRAEGAPAEDADAATYRLRLKFAAGPL